MMKCYFLGKTMLAMIIWCYYIVSTISQSIEGVDQDEHPQDPSTVGQVLVASKSV
uniref:Uncharacterized protein n=1 Tax=Arundo donax TaxID=35708 RepID=A0A0A9G1B7_ARUDO